jgi:chemotaxis protein MotB
MPREEETQRLESYDDVVREALKMAKPSRTPWVLLVLALAAGAALAVWLLYRLDRARSDAAASSSALQDARSQIEELRSERADLEMRLDRTQSEKAELAASQDELSRDVLAKQEEIAKLKGEMGELEDKMKAEIAKGAIRLSQAGGRIKVDVVDEILFPVGESGFSKQGEEVLARMKNKKITVSGHTDDVPISTRLQDRYPTNWELSAARAITVVRFLEEKAGVPGERLVAAAHSQYEPLATNKSTRGRARNRRIEILLTPAFDPTREAAAAQPRAPAAKQAAPAPRPKPPAPARKTAPAR